MGKQFTGYPSDEKNMRTRYRMQIWKPRKQMRNYMY